MKQFKNLEEVLMNLDTITMEEALDCHDRLGICFTLGKGGFVDAQYDMDSALTDREQEEMLYAE